MRVNYKSTFSTLLSRRRFSCAGRDAISIAQRCYCRRAGPIERGKRAAEPTLGRTGSGAAGPGEHRGVPSYRPPLRLSRRPGTERLLLRRPERLQPPWRRDAALLPE